MNQVVDFINVNRDRYVDELKQYLAIPSVSALPQHAADVRRAAEWTRDALSGAGLQNARLIDTPGNPVVYADWLNAPGKPTILFYGHYDVQPVDPVELWTSPPFEATVRDGEIYARGAADDKGQVFMHIKAVEAHLKQGGSLPLNIRFFIEGEEEVGSKHLDDFVRAHKQDLAADVVVISDSPMFDRGIPSICYGLPRPGLFPGRRARHEERSALRIVWRRGCQSGVRADADPVADEGSWRPHQDSGFLR
jgi:acetylornithine deacetylase/succinyl-diaminopimelate desuccinylase-like protein